MQCPKCGGTMIGDGYTEPRRCENLEDDLFDREPDSGPYYCDFDNNNDECNYAHSV